MSTAGKVLCFLTVVLMVVWVVTMAAVTEINKKGSKKVDDLGKELAKVGKELSGAKDAVDDLKSTITVEQIAKEQDLLAIRGRLAVVERQASTTVETLTRLQVSIADLQQANQVAKQALDRRNQEKVETTQAKAEAEALVQKLKGENEELLDQLTGLRTRFQQMTEENRKAVQKLRSASSAADAQPRVRAASFSR